MTKSKLSGQPVSRWLVLTCVLLAATAFTVAVALQILIKTLNTHLSSTPPLSTLGGYVWFSTPPLPQIFYSYLDLMLALAVADVMTLLRLQRKLHKNKAHNIDTTGSSQPASELN